MDLERKFVQDKCPAMHIIVRRTDIAGIGLELKFISAYCFSVLATSLRKAVFQVPQGCERTPSRQTHKI